MVPTLPLHLLPGMLPITQFNPFLNFPRMVPMITPPFLPVPPMFNMQMNLMNPMAMHAMTSRPELNAPSSTGFPTSIPMIPFPEAVQKESSNQIDAIPLSGQQELGNQHQKKENQIRRPLNAFMLFLKENRNIFMEEDRNVPLTISEINKELAKRWRKLSNEERRKYVEMADNEKKLHKEKYPNWYAKNNYPKNRKKPKKQIHGTMNVMAMQAMTPQLSAPSPTGSQENIRMVPFPETKETGSSYLKNTIPSANQQDPKKRNHKKKNYIKKPLNAFMLFNKENRKTLLEESGYDQMPAGEINKELGRRWQKMTDEERRKYFELAKIKRELHKEKYPEWSAADNYPKNPKKAEKRIHAPTQLLAKMCRARFGIEDMSKWCKYCLRKKKCILSKVLLEMTQNDNKETASETSKDNTETSSLSVTTPTDFVLDQESVSSTLQSREESLQTSLSTNSEAKEE
ncbi:hypothetical protein B9Z55_024683 [Caenorhabditis nigoni]|nr:hypothetical protein B9Z55_024683 [Caenorhabditis nigoni]